MELLLISLHIKKLHFSTALLIANHQNKRQAKKNHHQSLITNYQNCAIRFKWVFRLPAEALANAAAGRYIRIRS